MSGDLTPLVFVTGGQQLSVELVEVPRVRQRHPVIAPEVAGLALDPTLLVRFCRGTKIALEAPVRAKRDEPRRLLPPMGGQHVLHRTLKVVVSEQPKDPAKIMESVLRSLEKRLLGGAMIRAV